MTGGGPNPSRLDRGDAASAQTGSTLIRFLESLPPFLIGAALPVSMTLANKSAVLLFVVCAIVALAAMVLSGHKNTLVAAWKSLAINPLAYGLGLALLVAAASQMWSVDRSLSFSVFLQALGIIMLGAFAVPAFQHCVSARSMFWIGLGLVLGALLILFERWSNLSLHILVGARQDMASLKRSSLPLVMLYWPLMALLMHTRQRLATFGLGLLVVAAAIAAHSSTAMLAMLTGAVVFAAATRFPRFTLLVTGLGLMSLLFIAPVFGTASRLFVPPVLEQALSEAHASHRMQIWSAFEQRVSERPVMGHGFGSANAVWKAPHVAPATTSPEMLAAQDEVIRLIHPHNSFLQIWVEGGAMGGVIAAGLIGLVLRGLSKLPRHLLPPRLAFTAVVAAISLVGLGAWQAWWLATIAATCLWFEASRRANNA